MRLTGRGTLRPAPDPETRWRMGSGAAARWIVSLSAAGSLLVPGSLGCARGGSDDGVTGVAETDGAPADVASDRGAAPSADATSDASARAKDAPDTDDALDAPGSDAGATSDAVAEASSTADASVSDAAADGAIDAPADAADAALPPDASCTTTCGAQALCVGGLCTPSRRVFVSTQMFTGNLGGTSGADGACQSLASAAHLGGTWRAWVSDSATSPSTRFTRATVGYRLLDGTLLATGWAGLVSGALLHGVDLTEQRTAAPSSEVWTGTLESGVAIGADVCGGFTSSANAATHAVVGNTSRTDIGWSNATSQSCDQNNLRIYCLEQ